MLAVAYVIVLLVVRHALYDATPWRYQNCSLRIVRWYSYDGLQAATLSSMSVIIAFAQFLPIAALFATSPHGAAGAALAMSSVAIALLFVGQLIESGRGTVLEESALTWPSIYRLVTSPASCGAICGGHSIWHVMAVVAALLSLSSRELLLAHQKT